MRRENRQLVAVRGGKIVVLLPSYEMTKEEALVHAAYLVALADDTGLEFQPILHAVLEEE